MDSKTMEDTGHCDTECDSMAQSLSDPARVMSGHSNQSYPSLFAGTENGTLVPDASIQEESSQKTEFEQDNALQAIPSSSDPPTPTQPATNIATHTPRTILVMPAELIREVMKLLKDAGFNIEIVCFGLASKQFYPSLKSILPEPINLYWPVQVPSWFPPLHGGQGRLAHRLQRFMGPQYRIPAMKCCTRGPGFPNNQLKFLNRNVYGDGGGPGHRPCRFDEVAENFHGEEFKWCERNLQYRSFFWCPPECLEKKGSHSPWFCRSEAVPVLPNPWNRGEDWWIDAARALNEIELEKWTVYMDTKEKRAFHKMILGQHLGKLAREVGFWIAYEEFRDLEL